jgi:hypothetical protein
MNVLDYLLPQPAFDLTPEKQQAFDALFSATPPGGWVDYQLPYPKWQFLSYLCQAKPLVLHGSQNLQIEEVEPRKAQDVKAYSNQNAIYATTDGIWVIYFAIIDRRRFNPLSLFNSCLHIHLTPEQVLGPFYFFSITHGALIQNPWCSGAIYILPREHFEQEPPTPMLGVEVIFPHWISTSPALPRAKLMVEPQGFPFLAQVHGHDDALLAQLAAANPNGFPWPEALVI